MDTLTSIAIKIIQEQELIIGPLSWSEANKVSGLQVDMNSKTVVVPHSGEQGSHVIDALVSRYENLFGKASSEVCRRAASSVIQGLALVDIPMSLR